MGIMRMFGLTFCKGFHFKLYFYLARSFDRYKKNVTVTYETRCYGLNMTKQ